MKENTNNLRSIIDIAKIAEVSKSTVSRALTNDPKIKKETREHVLSIIEKYNFYPNYLARSLRTTITNSFGVIIGDINNPFYFDVISGIEKIADSRGYNFILVSGEYDYFKEISNIKTLISKKIDGVLVSSTIYNPDIIPLLLDSRTPFVFIDTQPFNNNYDFVYTDQIKSGYMAADYLVKRGHKNILIVYGPKRKFKNPFIEGYKNALKNAGIKLDKDLIIECPLFLQETYEAVYRLLKSNKKSITAIITSDHISLSIYKAIEDCGLRVPDDISVFGNDGIPIVKYFSPPLTTIFQPKDEMGEIATQILLDKISHKGTENKIIELEPRIIERKSVISI